MRKISEEIRQKVRDEYAKGGVTYKEVAVTLGVGINIVRESCEKKKVHRTLEERFWLYVDKSGGPEACWPWIGSLNPNGYGQIYVDEFKRPVVASRVSLFLSNGEYPVEACHRCDNPPCVNPAHLWDGTRTDNMKDCSAKGRVYAPSLRGLDNAGGKLSSDDVWQIRTLAYLCKPQDLAVAFGVSRGHIVNVINRRDRKLEP